MKKILFIVPSLKGGGVEKVLINMIKKMSDEKYDITILAILDEGERKSELPSKVHYKSIWKREFKIGGKRIKGTDRLFKWIFSTLSPKILHKLFINEKYDIEVDYWGQEGLKLVLGSGKQVRKYAFIHIDMNTGSMQNSIFPFKTWAKLKEAYTRMDKIINVSEDCQKSMTERFDLNLEEQKKNIVKYNINLNNEILQKASEKLDYKYDKEKNILCTSGRLCKQKGFERLITICGQLKKQGMNFELWILGEGEERTRLEKAILDNQLEQHVKLLGYQSNPYKYMSHADIFVCSSFYEGFSTVVSEAVILGIPIVTTNCTAAREILGDSEFGLVTEIDDNSLYEGLREMLTNKQMYQEYQKKVLERQAFFDMDMRLAQMEELFE